MAELSLLEAFRQCGPPIGDPAVDGPRREAMARLFEELQDLARRLARHGELARDAASETLIRFVQRGPLGERPGDPEHHEAVRRYLCRCLLNSIEDIRRRGRHEVLSDRDPVPTPRPQSGQDFELDAMREAFGEEDGLVRQLDEAASRLFQDVVPFTESQLRQAAREPFRIDVELRRQIAEGRKTIEEGVQELYGQLDRQTRNRFDQRQSRSLKRLGDGLEAYVKLERLEAAESYALRLAVQGLKEREAAWGTLPEEQL